MPATDPLLQFTARQEWRAWLQLHHHDASQAVLVLFNSKYRRQSMTLDDAVEEALCFGWIDGKLNKLDEKRYALRFTPRRPGSVWSARNIARVRKLTKQGLMTRAGLEKVAQARHSGHWEAALARNNPDVIPGDLENALRRRKGALASYAELSTTAKKQILYLLSSAKRTETRRKRIETVVAQLAKE